MKIIQMKYYILMGLLFVNANDSWSIDGVIEINQTCATQLGCFSGDSGGYPVSIDGTSGNSYKLTSDLIIPDANTTGIQINSANIQLDLNGFSIIRSDCLVVTDANFNYRPNTGSGYGIFVSATFYYGISIKNGSVIGMGNKGLFIPGRNSIIKNIHVRWNRREGIDAGNDIMMINNRAFENGGNGLECSAFCLIQANVSNKNLGDGIQASTGSMVMSNMLSDNTGFGLNFVFSGSSGAFRENVMRSNAEGTVNFGLDLGNNNCDTGVVCP